MQIETSTDLFTLLYSQSATGQTWKRLKGASFTNSSTTNHPSRGSLPETTNKRARAKKPKVKTPKIMKT